MSHLAHGADLVILVYFLALNSFYALLLVLSIPEIWEQTRLADDDDFQRLMQSDALPPITILVPAHNEQATIEPSITAILTLEYRNYEVVVVNDGSTDGTLEALRHAFDLYEIPRTYPETIATRPLRALYRSRTRTRLLVIDKENGGKADSLNAAINASRFPLVIAVDADTLIEPDALLRLTRPFLLGRQIAAVATLERLDSAVLATAALERLPTLVPTVGAYYAGMLRRSRPLVVQHLDKMLRRTDDPALPRLTEFAARLQEPALRERLTALAEHPDPEVRTQAVRALGGYPHPASVAALTRAAADAAWPVRAHAVRSLGMLADSATLPEVRAALRDGEWWVRLRAALALTRFGPGGRNALLEAEVGADPSARDMARLVLGLPAQALAEFAA